GVGEVPLEAVASALGAAGLTVGYGDDVTVTLVVVDDYLRPELATINEQALAGGRPWMLCRPMGRKAWFGPWMVPGQTACWACLARRLRDNAGPESMLRALLAEPERVWPPRGSTAAGVAAVAGMLAAVLEEAIVGESTALRDKLVELDPAELGATHHVVVRRPQCEACGDAGLVATRQQQPIVLGSVRKRFTSDGGHRQLEPEQTLARLEHLVDPITGVVPVLELIPSQWAEAARVAPLFDAGHNPARPVAGLGRLRHNFRNRSGGKGTSVAQARASGLCEAIERYCGVHRGDEARVVSSLSALGDAAVDPRIWLGFSEAQHRRRDAGSEPAASRVVEVPPRFDPEAEIGWTPAWSLRDQERRWLPTALCFYDYDHARAGEPFIGWADSNGTAAGNGPEEAILQGLFELVERDAVAIWWHNRLQRPAVDIASFARPALDAIVDFHRSLERRIWALDLTHDLGIPVIAAISVGPDDAQTPCFGFGAHLDPHIALSRALTELNQFLPYLESLGRGELAADLEVTQWLRGASLTRDAYLVPSAEPRRSAEELGARGWHDDIGDDVRDCVDRFARAGLDLIVLDQSRPDIDLRVMRVVAPGSCHFWPRYGARRLYEVPVALGWLAAPQDEAQLNPQHVFF
ncbi:MAG: TOMM precursor leader peptide-binding protein, partial [Myxococcales bacterium]|nr:TOMM precursor leader peptide-binding protein [Myxococcales bacterium]